MSTKRSGGSSKNLRDSQPKYLGVKRADGQAVGVGEVIVRQRGTKFEPGKNAKLGRDHTIYAGAAGVVSFRDMRKKRFDGRIVTKKTVDIVAA